MALLILVEERIAEEEESGIFPEAMGKGSEEGGECVTLRLNCRRLEFGESACKGKCRKTCKNIMDRVLNLLALHLGVRTLDCKGREIIPIPQTDFCCCSPLKDLSLPSSHLHVPDNAIFHFINKLFFLPFQALREILRNGHNLKYLPTLKQVESLSF